MKKRFSKKGYLIENNKAEKKFLESYYNPKEGDRMHRSHDIGKSGFMIFKNGEWEKI